MFLGHTLGHKYWRKARGFIMPPSEPNTIVIKITQDSNKFTRELLEEANISAAPLLPRYDI